MDKEELKNMLNEILMDAMIKVANEPIVGEITEKEKIYLPKVDEKYLAVLYEGRERPAKKLLDDNE